MSKPNKSRARSLAEWSLALVAALALFFVMRSFLLRTATVTGNSMEPTLSHSDGVLLSRAGYLFGNPKPGDIVAFPFKENPSEHYIKRIIGVPGDVIDLRSGRFYVNDQLLEDDFSSELIIVQYDAGFVQFPYTVEEGAYFVLGDNRNGSRDSRYIAVGCVPKKQMIGKVVLRFWPFSAFGTVR